MTKITIEGFKNFFKYYKGYEHQQRAIEELYKELECTCCDHLDDDSAWIQHYRNDVPIKPSEPEKSVWPITKQEMGDIMGCSPDTLPDSLMDDFARCVADCEMDKIEMVYFLGQCGHESAGLRYPVEIHDGSNYEGRKDLNNIYPGDGVKFAGTGWIQVTGRYNHQRFSDFLQKSGQFDANIMEVGKTYTSQKYPWSISGLWWRENGMKEMCLARKECTNYQIDEIGARVNGRMRPNGADDRIAYTDKAYRVIIGV